MIYSYEPFGYEVTLNSIETETRELEAKQLPTMRIVGISDSVVKRTIDIVKSALKNSGYELPRKDIMLGVEPYDRLKKSSNHDLALALSVRCHPKTDVLVLGGLDENGEVYPAKGAYAAMQEAISQGIKYAIVGYKSDYPPEGNISVSYVKNLNEAVKAMEFYMSANNSDVSFPDADVKDDDILLPICSEKTARAVIVAAAGKHNVVLWGKRGCGKEIAAEALRYITPLPTPDESQSINRIHSIAGLLTADTNFTPFRKPHQTVNIETLLGGGVDLHPGEISLAHNGILYLQEAAWFRSSCLQFLKVQMSSGFMTLYRAGRNTMFPSVFQLVLTTNGCLCGNFSSADNTCHCGRDDVENLWKKLSYLDTDRIPLRVEVVEPTGEKSKSKITVAEAKRLVENAIKTQRKRGIYNGRYNVDYSNTMAKEALEIADSSVFDNFSDTEKDYVLAVARTLADMEQTEQIEARHINEAIELHQTTPLGTWEK